MKTKQTKVSVLFMLFSILFTVCLITANLLGAKQIALGPISLTGGILIFPISYIINDCVCEVWGYSKVRLLIWTGFLMDFFFVAVCGLCDIIPGAPYWDNDAGFHAIFGLAPRIAFASFMAFIIGSFINAYVMSKMKLKSKGKHFSVRAILSTILGEGADSLIFFPIAFLGVIPTSELPLLMFWQVVIKTSYEIVVLPITIQVVNWVKKHEEEDAYDEGIDYDILKIFTI
ncbi:MAG: queuosine precursor transporter [Prevotella sp.]|nr:queuosine precursor transporter [Prevotella sp.]